MLGFAGQGLFGCRLILQWWLSEKKGFVVSPTVYWYLSLGGSFLFLIYGLLREDPIIIFGQFLSFYIYVRNLQLKNAWIQIPLSARIGILILPLVTIGLLGDSLARSRNDLFTYFTDPIMIIGGIGQLALNLRFVYQWFVSEKQKTSVLPFGFWFISTWASVLVIVYALFHPIYEIEPVLLVSQGLGIVVYIRNMILASRSSKKPENV